MYIVLCMGGKAVYYWVRIGTSTLSEFNKSSQVPTTRKKFGLALVLVMVVGTLGFSGFFGDMGRA